MARGQFLSATLTALNDALTLPTFQAGGVGVQLTGTWVGTVSFEATVDGATWPALEAWPSNSATAVTSATANGLWQAPVAGFTAVRLRFSTATSGSVVAYAHAVLAPPKAEVTTVTALPSGTQDVNVAQVNGQTVNVGTGTAGTGTQRVAVASDSSLTANAGTNLNTSLLALEAGGNLATLAGGVSASVYQSNTKQINGVAPSMGNGIAGTGVQRVTLASDSTGQLALAAGSQTIGALTANQSVNVNQIAGTGTATGNGAATAGTQRVTIASDSTGATKEPRATTTAVTSVAGSASNVTLLASNTSRLQTALYNDSTASLYLKLGTTASTSSFTVRIFPNGYYELPWPSYTGQMDGIWDAANGNARITELS